MTVQLKWPILGVIIPCVIIFSLSYGSHYFILQHHLTIKQQLIYEFYATMIWISYLFAIYTNPGRVPTNYKPSSPSTRIEETGNDSEGLGLESREDETLITEEPISGDRCEWIRYCKKCNNYKPPRSHHCKICKQCVLQMDHHCPWTMNCVGNNNLPHFMRFLGWVIWGTGYLMIQLIKLIINYYENSNMPHYLFNKTELVAIIVITPINLFVFATILVLFIRCLINICKGMTQIEIWEWERLELQWSSKRLWRLIRFNYRKLHNDKPFPKLSTWTNTINNGDYGDDVDVDDVDDVDVELTNLSSNNEEPIVPQNFTIDDLIFPYDLGIWKNLINAMNYPYMWLIPFAKPKSNGYQPEISQDYLQDDQLNLPWPPDGIRQQEIEINVLHQQHSQGNEEDEELRSIRNYQELRRRLDPRLNVKRTDFVNDMGEGLTDFGVDEDSD
ncbi:palmitoyltransferase, putative [Candida dubliniensis CD36]|uniref:Palmitoyltransferase PFA4 n=1 Tax=Candida dubliniensis (strain CD36 / ATCC MYA-646 / CBS 7987 / NCPF 3949 / NRRL Y-17841) TaxID=573826 RepID=B9WK34_CANDC|nr:palmitoyltransferase, putative [Candida dubliniensis CD36]CAX40685.1 palmitoyltransferase, putative [Candida dubliniensis CD36]